ncbi:hypothetical protein [Pseudoalteromonas sp. Of7M-16]|nr:hypothetical protein [Pseudoalteromonas sp. Of7M-16]MCG7550750.1 hypothetical protein [Pseudoalteromonas sp. Of7M-16]
MRWILTSVRMTAGLASLMELGEMDPDHRQDDIGDIGVVGGIWRHGS